MRLVAVSIYNSFYDYQFIPKWACSECGFEFGETEALGLYKYPVATTEVCPLCGRKLNREGVVTIVDSHKFNDDDKKRFNKLKRKFNDHGCKSVAVMLRPEFEESEFDERSFGDGWDFHAEFNPYPEFLPFMFNDGMLPKTITGEEFEQLRIYVHKKEIAERFVNLLDKRFGKDAKRQVYDLYGIKSDGVE